MPQVIETSEKKIDTSYIQFVHFKDLTYWDFNTYFRTQKNNYHYPAVKLEEVISQRKGSITIDDDIKYKRPTVKLYGGGVFLRDEVLGKDIKVKRQQICRANDLLVAEIDAKVGGFGIIPDYLEGAIVSSHYFLFEVDTSRLDLEYIGIYIKTAEFQKQVQATGSTNYAAIRPHHFLGYTIPLPDIATQKRIVSEYYEKIDEANRLDALVIEKEKEIENYLTDTLGITIKNSEKKVGLNFVRFKNIQKWGTDFILENHGQRKSNFEYKRLDDFCTIIMGASPDSKSLNEKGNGYPFIGGAVEMNEEKQVFEISRYCDKPTKINELGDIVFCVRATIGKPIVADKQYCLGRGVGAIRLETDRVLFEYLFLILKQAVPELIEKGTGSTFKQITKQVLASHKVSIPPKEVQTIIVKYIKAIKTEILEMKNESKKLRIDAKNFFERELFSI